ncbi:MAG: DUF502 domain-containing protein [Candidatus Hydrogenedentes bacterium]|nr:DUF502 domain-containing protein [Candidatus Hydrogenedentota bacterium]
MSKKKSLVKRHGMMSFLRRYIRLLRFYLVTGLLVWVPLIVTVWLTWWLFSNVGLSLENVIRRAYGALNELGARVEFFSFLRELKYQTGVGFVFAVAIFILTGIFARNLVGRRFIRLGERILARIPVIRNVYSAVQQIRDVFVRRDGTVFQQVCLVEYPRKGIYAVAFVTSDEHGVVQEKLQKDLISIFLPTTPNPTSGFLLYVQESEITRLDITVEEAMKLIVSAGAYIPKAKGEEFQETEPLPLPMS